MGDQKVKSNSTNVLIIAAVWASVLLAGFLYFRGEDLGKIGSLLSNLLRGNLFGLGGFGESLAGIFIALLIALAWYGLGSFKASYIEKFFANGETETKNNSLLEIARHTTIGAAIWSFLWFFLGLFGLYNKTVAIGALVIGLAFAALGIFNRKREGSEKADFDLMGQVAFLFIAFLLLLTLISSVAPPIAKDTLLYHFAVPRDFISAGNNAVIEGNIASYLALGTEMHAVWAMLLGGAFSPQIAETAAGATIFMFAPVLLLAVYGWARETGLDKTWALITALLVASIPTFYHIASSAYIDVALALFITLAIHATTRWWQSLEKKWLAYLVIFLGGALAIKLTAVFSIIAIALVMLLRLKKVQDEGSEANIKSIFVSLLLTFAGIGLLASPWYLRDLAATGSPVFPFYMNILKGTAPGWDVERSTFFQVINANYGGANKGVIDYLISPAAVSLKAQPELPEFFDGVLGVVFIFGLPFAILAYRKFKLGVEVKIAFIVSGVLFAFWLFTSQQLRYLLPIFPVMAIAICLSLDVFSKNDKTLRRGLIAILFVASVVNGGVTLSWFAKKNPLQSFFGGESRDEYLTRNIDYYPYYQVVNFDLPDNSKVWLINMRRDTYHIARPYFSDYMFEDWTLKKLSEESKNLDELRAKVKQMGITHILVRHDFLLDYKQSVLVDDKRAEKENQAKLDMVKTLILDGKNVIKADKKFSLVRVP